MLLITSNCVTTNVQNIFFLSSMGFLSMTFSYKSSFTEYKTTCENKYIKLFSTYFHEYLFVGERGGGGN